MVCLGNICRSPLAEGILQNKIEAAGLNWFVDSAGTNGYHVGEAPHHLSQKVSLANGINIISRKHIFQSGGVANIDFMENISRRLVRG